MKNGLGVSVVAVTLALVAGCGGGGSPGSGTSPAATGGESASPSIGVTDAPARNVDGGTGCLVDGSPWTIDTADLERQYPGVMGRVNVTGVHIDGAQKLVVAPDLQARFSDNSTTTIKVAMAQSMTLQLIQKHAGSATGKLTPNGNRLTPERWTGGIHGTNTVTINGRSSQAPFDLPETDFGDRVMTYSCSAGELRIQVQGSPFHYLFTSG